MSWSSEMMSETIEAMVEENVFKPDRRAIYVRLLEVFKPYWHEVCDCFSIDDEFEYAVQEVGIEPPDEDADNDYGVRW